MIQMKTILFSFVLLAYSFLLPAQDLPSIPAQVEKLNKINSQANCQSCLNAQPLSHDKATLLTDINSKTLEQSVLNLAEANALVSEFLNNTSIPFDYALDGCFARAHKMAFMMEEKGIISAKAFIIGRLFASTKYGPVSWRYHVAPVVLVKINDQIKPYIIDPALFDKAVPYEEWKNLITGAGNGPGRSRGAVFKGSEYYTNRFVYDPTNAKAELSDYQAGDMSDADNTLAKLQDIKKQLDAKKSGL